MKKPTATTERGLLAKRWLWFIALYLAGVAAVALLGFAFRLLFQASVLA